MRSHEAGARALLIKIISTAREATPRTRDLAGRFSDRFDTYREEGLSNATAYAMAMTEAAVCQGDGERERALA